MTLGLADGVAAANAGKPVGLREGTHPQHVRPRRVDRRQCGGRADLAIGLVEQKHRRLGQRLDEAGDLVRLPPGAHRIVGIGEIDERAPFPGCTAVEQVVEALPVVLVGHGDQPPARARDMEVEGRVGAERRHHRRARLDEHAHDQAEQPVDALADNHVFVADAEMRRQCRLQVEIVGVAIHPHVGGRGRMAAITDGAGPKLLSLAPMRARNGLPRVRSCASGPTKGTVSGNDWTSGVSGGRWAMRMLHCEATGGTCTAGTPRIADAQNCAIRQPATQLEPATAVAGLSHSSGGFRVRRRVRQGFGSAFR